MSRLRLISSTKLRNFFLWLKSKEFLVFLFFFFVSSFFWLMLTMKDVAQKEIAIPFAISKVPDNVRIIPPDENTLRVTVRDNKYNLLTYQFQKTKKRLLFDFNAYNNENGKITLSSSDLSKKVKDWLERSSELVSVKPDHIDIDYVGVNDVKKVRVAYRNSMFLTAAENREITRIVVVPESVTVYATKSIRARLDSVETHSFTISDVVDKSRKDNVRLVKYKGVLCEPNEVAVEAYADILAQDTVRVPVVPVNVPEGKTMHTFPGKVVVRYTVLDGQRKHINEDAFAVEVDYNDIRQGEKRDSLPLRLRTKLPIVRGAHMDVRFVEYAIE